MGIGFTSTFLYIFGDTMEGTSSSRSESWTTLGVETSSGDYEAESNYRTVNASVQTTHDAEMSTGTKDQSNSCPDSHKDFCIHGTCQYNSELKTIYCICHEGYYEERCQSFSLQSKYKQGYDLETVISVVAVVLSVSCVAIFGLLLVIRHQKKHKRDVKCEEKVHLEATPSP